MWLVGDFDEDASLLGLIRRPRNPFDTSHERAGARVAAQDLFERLLAQGSIAFKCIEHGRRDEKVTELSALENETIVVPRVVGG